MQAKKIVGNGRAPAAHTHAPLCARLERIVLVPRLGVPRLGCEVKAAPRRKAAAVALPPTSTSAMKSGTLFGRQKPVARGEFAA
eukprot:5867227-Pleurochrysis_carterae.AAC.1